MVIGFVVIFFMHESVPEVISNIYIATQSLQSADFQQYCPWNINLCVPISAFSVYMENTVVKAYLGIA